jgi:drug/metabolite transporter (DMT)-like permease
MSPHTRNLLRIHVAVLLFGFAGLFGNRKLLPLSPVVIVFGRVVFASLTLLVAVALGRRALSTITGRGLLAFASLGVLLAIHWTTFFQAVQTSSVALALITFSTFPVFVAFLEPLFFREKLRPADVVLAATALAGIVILTPSFALRDRATQGVLWGVASGLTFAFLSLLNRKYIRRHSSITIALYQDVFAALALLPFVVGQWPDLTLTNVLMLGVLGVFCTAIAHALFIAGMHGIPTRTASTIACLEPVYGTILAVLFLDEAPSWRTLLGGAIVLAVAVCATVRAGGSESIKDKRAIEYV